MRSIYRIVIHYTDSPDVSARTIDFWHLVNGWAGIGYHAVVRKDGSIEDGRSENQRGAHAGAYNAGSLGVVLTGSEDMPWYPAEAQYKALNKLLKQWMNRYSIIKEQIYFHREVRPTLCPGRLDKKRILRELEGGDMLTELQKVKAVKMDWGTYWCQWLQADVGFPGGNYKAGVFRIPFEGFIMKPVIQLTLATGYNYSAKITRKDESSFGVTVTITDSANLKDGAIGITAHYVYPK